MAEVTAQEIAQRTGRSLRRLQLRANKENWPYTTRSTGRAPVRVYQIAQLPDDIRTKLMAPELPSQADVDFVGARDDTYANAPQKHREESARRLRAIQLYEHHRGLGFSTRQAASLVHETLGTARASLHGWLSRVRDVPREQWPTALLPKWRSVQQLAPIHKDAWNWICSDYGRQSAPSKAACYRRLETEAEKHPEWLPLPGFDSVSRRMNRELDRNWRLIRRGGTKAFDDAQPTQRRDKSALYGGQYLNADGHKLDIRVQVPAITNGAQPGRVMRVLLLAWQCIHSAKIVGWRLDTSENGDVIRLSFADAIKVAGIPEQVYLDNGRAFMDKRMTGGLMGRFRYPLLPDEVPGIFSRMGVELHCTKPYSGRSKPIERAFRDLCEDIAKDPLCEGAYTGNNPVNKPENYAGKAVLLSDLQELVDRKIVEHNARAGRRTAIHQGRSFDEVFEESRKDRIIRYATEEELLYLMMGAKNLRISPVDSSITLLGNRYYCEALAKHTGQKVTVRFDPGGLHHGIWVFVGTSLKPLCHVPCVGPYGFSDTEAARFSARQKAAYAKLEKQKAQALGTLTADDLAGRSKTKRKRSGNVVDIGAARPKRGLFAGETPEEKQQAYDDAFDEFFGSGLAASK